jgi:uncharacterized Zn finger protein (UPF0148 family)
VDTLEVLRCRKCDAPLVLADSETVTCGSCGEVNPVPEPYRELHRARLADKSVRERAELALRRIDRPPSMVTKVLARVFDQNMFVFMLVYGAPITIGAIKLSLRMDDWIAAHSHYATGDDVPFGYMLVFIVGALFLWAFVPRALGVYANRRVTDRTKLLAALAARPPKVPGAAATCRICGAPLAVDKDAIVAVCSYCRAQNAVHLETKVAVETQTVSAAVGREMADALRQNAHDRAATRRLLFRELRRYTLRTALLGVGFYLGSMENPDKTSTTVGVIAIVATTLLFMYFILSSGMHHDEDAEDRRAGNDAPEWLGWVGPIVALVLLFRIC